MLNAQKMAAPYLMVSDPDLLALVQRQKLPVMPYPSQAEFVDLSGANIVVLDRKDAQRKAIELAETGVDPTTIEWLDDVSAPGGLAAFLETGAPIGEIASFAKDLYYDEIRPLADAQDEPGLAERIPSGFPFLDKHIQWRRRELIVCAGAYGCGKSTLMQLLALKWAESAGGRDREKPVWFCTWEDDPLEQKDQVLRHYTNGLGSNGDPDSGLTAQRMQERILHTRPELDRERRLDWFAARARHMNKKYGTNFFVLDPWSEFDHVRDKDQSETQYVKEIMKLLSKLSVELDSIFCVVTHITKSKYNDDGSIRPFRVADSMGSVNFGTSMTRGFCVLRWKSEMSNTDRMVVRFDKVKIERTMGKKGTVALVYDSDRHNLEIDLDASRDADDAWEGRK